jgi:hypothetical protein
MQRKEVQAGAADHGRVWAREDAGGGQRRGAKQVLLDAGSMRELQGR